MFKICTVFLLVSATYTHAAVGLYPSEPKPAEFADQQGCYLKVLNKVIPYNVPYYPRDNKSCTQYKCSEETKVTRVFSCGTVAVRPGCRKVSDLTKDYPDCCPKQQCD